MYNQFCKNLKNFIVIIDENYEDICFRKETALTLLKLTDIDAYNQFKIINSKEYKSISNMIYKLSLYTNQYTSLKRLVWELWAYGFDVLESEEESDLEYKIDELVKVADLMMSTHYFV